MREKKNIDFRVNGESNCERVSSSFPFSHSAFLLNPTKIAATTTSKRERVWERKGKKDREVKDKCERTCRGKYFTVLWEPGVSCPKGGMIWVVTMEDNDWCKLLFLHFKQPRGLPCWILSLYQKGKIHVSMHWSSISYRSSCWEEFYCLM